MNVPHDLFYTKTHEWVKKEGKRVRVGITDHAQHEITDVVHVELPTVGRKAEAGKPCAVVESVKSAFDIYAPVSGTVVEVNTKLDASPELVNQHPYGDGFFFVIEMTDENELKNLMAAKEYSGSIQ